MSQEISIIKSEDANKVVNQMLHLEQRLDEIANRSFKKLYTDTEFIDLLHICKKTAQNYRDKGLIGFVKVGNRIFYRDQDIDEFIESHYNPKFK
jgi:hypothetical protein